MKPLDDHALADAVPLTNGREERNAHVRKIARFCPEADDRAVARYTFATFRRYREGAWLREALHDDVPPQRLGSAQEHAWRALRAMDRSISFSTTRRILGHI